MNKTKIEWARNPDGTSGYTWNPITGCLNGCSYCYARKLANTRLKGAYRVNTNLPTHDEPDHLAHHLDPFYPRFWEDRLFQPVDKAHLSKNGIDWINHRQKAKGIFVCDMSDLFGVGIPEDWTRRVLDAIEISKPTHRFYLLTKQPQNLLKFSPFPDNCYVGVSATNEIMAAAAYAHLERIEAKVKYVSLEPLLHWDKDNAKNSIMEWRPNIVNWVIIGSQTKPYKPPKIEWVEEIVRACDKAGIPVFLKNNLAPALRAEKPFMTITKKFRKYPRQEMPLLEGVL